MTHEEVIARIQSGRFANEYGFDLQILVNAVGALGEMLRNGYTIAPPPRVMTLEEVHEGDVMWFDSPGNFIMRPVICVMHDRGDSSYLVFAWQYGTFTWRISDYGIGWRCWTARPTEEQRREVRWNA